MLQRVRDDAQFAESLAALDRRRVRVEGQEFEARLAAGQVRKSSSGAPLLSQNTTADGWRAAVQRVKART